jgi:ribosome-binding factor A
MTSHRRARVNGLMREELALILSGELADPRLAPVTVSDVEISEDMRHLRVYYSVLDDDPVAEREARRGLDHASGYLRRKLAEHVNLRLTPELSFHLDRTEARAQRIDQLLAEIATQPPLADAPTQPDDTPASEP